MIRVALVLVLFGCGGSSEPVDFGPEEFAAAYREASCQRFVRCGLFASVEACNASPLPDLPIPKARCSQAAVDAGELHWDSGGAHACIADTAAQSCDAGQTLPHECLHLAEGDTPLVDSEGGVGMGYCDPTGNSLVCVEGAACHSAAPGHGASGCVTIGVLGSPCPTYYPDLACQPGLYCGGPSPQCMAGAGHGEDCSAHGACIQIGDACTNGICQAYVVEGQACSADEPCSPYLVCDATQHCAAVPAAAPTCD